MAPLLCPIDISRVRVWGRPAVTGSGNKSPLVAIESARLEQRRGMLTFDEIMAPWLRRIELSAKILYGLC